MSVYEKISKVQGELSKVGIAKNNQNKQQGYSFRGIDDIYQSLAPLLASNQLCILPRVLGRACEEKQTKSGGTLFYTVVEVEFDFVDAQDSTKHTVKTFGEAMDSADKSTNKAMSAAYKYACLQTFCIPTEGDNDADATTHEPAIVLVGESELLNLIQALEIAGYPTEEFLAKAELKTLSELPLNRFAAAMSHIQKRAQQ